MKKKIIILAIMAASTVLTLPFEGFAGNGKDPASVRSTNGQQISVSFGQPRRRRRVWRHNRWVWVGYRNYGQYRSSRNRYRMVRRYYWDDGFRRTRWVRVYY